jgi:hypothetical protein
MALVLLTLIENMQTKAALKKYKDGLGGEPCVNLLDAK